MTSSVLALGPQSEGNKVQVTGSSCLEGHPLLLDEMPHSQRASSLQKDNIIQNL